MTLPPEIRNIIYESVLAYPSGRYFIGRSARSSEPPFLQAASPEMRKEAAPIFYQSHKFRMDLSVDGDEMVITVETLRDIIDLCGSNPFTSFKFWIQGRQHGKLFGLLPLLELIRATGLVLRTNDRLMDCLWGARSSCKDFEAAVVLARQAHHAGWSATKLAQTYKVWCKDREQR